MPGIVMPLSPPPTMSDDRLDNFITGTNYQPLDVVGEGAYGIVWSAHN